MASCKKHTPYFPIYTPLAQTPKQLAPAWVFCAFIEITLIFTLTGTLNRIRVKNPVRNIGIFDTKWVLCANKSFKNTTYSRNLEFKSCDT